MVWNFNDRDVPYIQNYTQALTCHANIQPWRGYEPNERPLAKRSQHHITIRKLHDGSVACKLYNTDVVTYHPDNTVTLVPYASKTTDVMVSRLLNLSGVAAHYTSGVVRVQSLGGDHVFCRTQNRMRFCVSERNWLVMLDTPKPFVFKKLRVKVANAAYKAHGYPRFRDWVTTLAAQNYPCYGSRSLGFGGDILAALADRDRWLSLLQAECGRADSVIAVEATLRRVRMSIVDATPDVYAVTEEPVLHSWADLARWHRN